MDANSHKGKEEGFVEAPLSSEEKPIQGEQPVAISKPDECEEKCAKLTERLARLQAEFENAAKRNAKEKESTARHAEGKLMLKLLSSYEEIALAENEAGKISDTAVRKGVLLVLQKLRAAFEHEGLSEMKLEGEKFDPFRHEGATRVDSDAPEGAIVHVIRKGYLFRGEVLQHAIVAVSSGKKPGERDGGAEGSQKDGEENGV